ncbi:hypothetical protein [Thermaerobacter litoralis]
MPASAHPVPKCYLVVAYAPPRVSARAANDAFNRYIADTSRGLVLTHDHFIHPRGGYAIFACEREEQVRRVTDAQDELPGWQVSVHPLTFAHDAVTWLYQSDFTLAWYRGGQRLRTWMNRYEASEHCHRLESRLPSQAD